MGTRITCTNSTGGRTSTVLSTRGGAHLKDNFTLVFGQKSVYYINGTCKYSDI